eukprot:GILJ01003738.1.p1 GENE.GILJ01003738.1~~GILJ01003738.1.p1  ORF type:complete len:281 (+),score=26.30 GILJ01003738.1:55-897(+)
MSNVARLSALKSRSKEWEQDATFLQELEDVILAIQHPHFSEHLNVALSLVLPIVDDFEAQNKVFGLKLFHHMVKETNAAELRWYSTPIIEVMKSCLSFREAPYLSSFLPCLIDCIAALDPHPQSDMRQHFLAELLRLWDFALKVDERKVYGREMPRLLTATGRVLIRHLQTLFHIIYGSLEFGDSEMVLQGLSTLTIVLKNCWPNISKHIFDIVQRLAIVYLNISDTHSQDVFPSLRHCLKLLSACDSAQLQTCLSALESMTELKSFLAFAQTSIVESTT